MDRTRRLRPAARVGLATFVLSALCASAAENDPTVLSVPPSQYWDGIDGPWSTFGLQVGTPSQQVRVLPGTGLDTTWVVHPLGCTSRDPDDCSDTRGGLFQSGRSTSWSEIGLYQLSVLEEAKLGLSGNGTYGSETVTLGWPGNNLPTVKDQVVAGIATKDFYMGALPLSPWSVNFTTLDNSRPSLMTSLKNHSSIYSLTWGYTAGSYNLNPPVFGSLTLGGYDERRFEANKLNFSMGADISREFLVSVQSIYTNISTSALLSAPIFANIDSLIAQMWLPLDACQAFERAFGLTWNTNSDLYLVNATQHARLLERNPEVTLNIGPGSSGDTVTIHMPYSSFSLNVSRPILPSYSASPLRYFPLKRADNSSQYTLGRVFLQNAYVTANYEYFNFSVSQAKYPSGNSGQKLVRLCPKGGCHQSSSSSSTLSTGAIVGIVIGILALFTLIGLAIWYFLIRPKRLEKKQRGEYALASAADADAKHNGEGGSGGLYPAEVGLDDRYQLDGKEKSHAELGDTESHGPAELGAKTHEVPGDQAHVYEMAAPGTAAVEMDAAARQYEGARNSPATRAAVAGPGDGGGSGRGG